MWRIGVFLGSITPPPQGGAGPQRSPILGVLCLCQRPLTQKDHVRQGNTCGAGRVSRGPQFSGSYILISTLFDVEPNVQIRPMGRALF